MSTTTSRLALTKPATSGENIDVALLNANADKIDANGPPTICTSSTRPASPYNGQIIKETDTSRVYIRDGSTWIRLLTSDVNSDAAIGRDLAVGRNLAVTGNITGTLTGAVNIAPTAWTPTFSQGPSSLGSGAVREGWYWQFGKMVIFQFRITFGTSPAMTAATLWGLTLPVAAIVVGGAGASAGFALVSGSWGYRDQSTGANYAGATTGLDSGGATVGFGGAWTGSAPTGRMSDSSPFTIGVDDVLSGSGMYRAA